MARSSVVDETAARELVLWAENTQRLYSQRVSIEHNLQRKYDKGVYDHEKAVKLWGYWMDAAAHDYCKEFGCSMSVFSKATRVEAARQMEAGEYPELELGNWRQ